MAVGTFATGFNLAYPTLVLSGHVANVDHGTFVPPVLDLAFNLVLSGKVGNVDHGVLSFPVLNVTFSTILIGTVQ